MSTFEIVLLSIGCACGGAAITNAIWLRVYRRQSTWTRERLDWWYGHSGRIIQGALNMAAIAERSMARGDWYRDYLDGKIVIDDPMAPPGKERAQA